MRQVTKTYEIFTFEELAEPVKEKVLTKFYDINVDHDWYTYTYEDAEQIGLEITGFDLGRGRSIEGKLTLDLSDVIKKIMENHGKDTDTFKLAESTKKRFDVLEKGLKDLQAKDGDTYDLEGEIEELEKEFETDLLNEYLSMLGKDYEYNTSSEAIIETMQANEFEFTKEGLLFRE